MTEETQAARRIGKTKYGNLLAHARRTSKQVKKLSGEYREAVGEAVENDNLDKRAHSIVVKLDKLEPEDLRRTLDDLEYLLDISGLTERAASVQPMQFDPAAGDEAAKAEGEDVRPRHVKQRDKDNVQPIKPPTQVAAE